MRVQTLSILAGSEACNARCPFCVSKMTPLLGVELKEPEVNWRNFRKACLLAKQSGATTVMFTGKGEPTLFPAQITGFLKRLRRYEFPIIELQSNGIMLAEKPEIYDAYLREWYNLGLNTIAISIVHVDAEKNRQIYLPYKKAYIDLPALIKKLHAFKFSVRLTCIMAAGFIDSVPLVNDLIDFARVNAVEQLTVTPVNKPAETEDPGVWQWTAEHHLPEGATEEIGKHIAEQGTHILTLPYGAQIYDVHGQNVCFNRCLTVQPDVEVMRNLIFFPDGHLRYYWQYPGAILF